MTCTACKEDVEGAPILVPSLVRKPFTFCGKGACVVKAKRKANTIWPAALRARKTRR